MKAPVPASWAQNSPVFKKNILCFLSASSLSADPFRDPPSSVFHLFGTAGGEKKYDSAEMVGEIFQEILSTLSLVAILVCLVTTVFILVPSSDEAFRKGESNSVADSADKEKLNDRNHRNFQGIRDLGEGRIIGLSGTGLLSKGDDDHEEEPKFGNLESANAVGNDRELFSAGEVLDELSEEPILSSKMREQQEEGLISGDENGPSEAKMETADELNPERACHHEEEEEGFLFDDWEGIERTELERLFGKAVAFVSSKSNADLLDTNLKLQLYALHKVATEGPCHLSPPIALKLSARAKWNAWQRLGIMNMDMAMEQYMILLSKSIPEWEER